MHASTSGKYNNAIREVNALSKCGRLLTQQSQMLLATCLGKVRKPFPPPRRDYKSYSINEAHVSQVWQDFIDKNMQ